MRILGPALMLVEMSWWILLECGTTEHLYTRGGQTLNWSSMTPCLLVFMACINPFSCEWDPGPASNWQDMAKATDWQCHDCSPLYQITLLVVDSHVCFSAAFIEARKLCHSFTILPASLSLNSCGYSFRSLLWLPLTSFLPSGGVPICVNLTFHL